MGIPPRSFVGWNEINERRALSLSTVYRAQQIITTALQGLTIDGIKSGQVLASTPSLLTSPNVNDSLPHFIEQTAGSLALKGNAYWLVDTNDAGQVINLTILSPDFVTPIFAGPFYQITAWGFNGQILPPERIAHLKLTSQFGDPRGLGPLQAAGMEINGAIETRDFAASWFYASGVPGSHYLTTDQQLNAEQAKANRDAWNTAANDRAGIPILTGGLKLQNTLLSPSDAQWIENQQFNVTTVARLFGIPESLFLAAVDGGTSVTYANIADREISFVRYTLGAYITEIESALSALLPRGTTAKFNLEGLLRSDTDSRYAAYAVGITAGWLLPSEVRSIEGLPPKAGIDKPKPAPVIVAAPAEHSAAEPVPAPTKEVAK